MCGPEFVSLIPGQVTPMTLKKMVLATLSLELRIKKVEPRIRTDDDSPV